MCVSTPPGEREDPHPIVFMGGLTASVPFFLSLLLRLGTPHERPIVQGTVTFLAGCSIRVCSYRRVAVDLEKDEGAK